MTQTIYGQKKAKYNNVKVNGYASRKEAQRASTLQLMEKGGLISYLYEQVPFELIPSQYEHFQIQGKRKMLNRKKCIENSCTYIADFVYLDNETHKCVVDDSKGMRTEVFKIKKKLMLQRYGIKIKES